MAAGFPKKNPPFASSHPTVAEIDLSAFRNNLRLVRQRIGPHRSILAVVKANAYGHGLIPVSNAAISEKVQGLGVAFVEEGVRLRKARVKVPILVMAGFLPEEAEALVRYQLTPVISHPDQLEWLRRRLKSGRRPTGIHLKIDTGMGRLGISIHDVAPFIERLRPLKNIEVAGLMSHFADDDLADSPSSLDQLERFKSVQRTIEAMGLKIPLIHIANSAAIVNLERSWLDMVRPGIMLYGYGASGAIPWSVKPVMTLKTRITQLRRVPPGTTISYGRTFKTRRESLIAVLPIGYADGYSRAWSNCGRALIEGSRVPVIGRVCMDMTMVDVTELSSVRIGDEAVLMGIQKSEALWADELARELNTIPYEILCSISQRVPRIYREGEGA